MFSHCKRPLCLHEKIPWWIHFGDTVHRCHKNDTAVHKPTLARKRNAEDKVLRVGARTVSLIVGVKVIRGRARSTPKLSSHRCVNSLHEEYGMDLCTPVQAPGTPNRLVDDATEDTLWKRPTSRNLKLWSEAPFCWPRVQDSLT